MRTLWAIITILIMVGAIIVSALYGCGLCGCGGSAGPSVPSTPPVAIEGLDGGTDVEIDSSFKYTFSKDVDSDTVSATTFFIVEAPSAEASVSLSPKISPKAAYDSNVCDVDQALAGTVSCSSATECILTPDSDLAANTTYGICLLPGTTAADGETLVGIWYDDGTAFEEGVYVVFGTGGTFFIANPRDGKNILRWSAVDGAASYNLYWSTISGVTTATGTQITGINDTTYTHGTDSPLSDGTPYYYIYTSVDVDDVESEASGEVRGTPNPEIDPTFGTNGVATIATSSAPDSVMDVTTYTNSDGEEKIVVLAVSGTPGAGDSSTFVLWQLDSDGVSDTTFGTSGAATYTAPTGATLDANRVLVDAYDRIFVIGSIDEGTEYMRIWCYTETGSSCTDFSTSSGTYTYTTAQSTGNDAVFVSADGVSDPSICVGGTERSLGMNMTIFCVDLNGILVGFDRSDTANTEGQGIAYDDNGNIILGGRILTGLETSDMYSERYDISEADWDPTFGGGGAVRHSDGINTWFSVPGIVVQEGGRIVYLIQQQVDTETNEFTSIMMGYYSTGLLDPLFATNGTYSSDTYVAEKLFLDPFDRILAGGFYSESGESDVAVWRFDSDGTFQSGFGSSGYLVEMASVSDSVSVTMDSSNRILMAGSACAEMTGGECASFDMAIWAYR